MALYYEFSYKINPRTIFNALERKLGDAWIKSIDRDSNSQINTSIETGIASNESIRDSPTLPNILDLDLNKTNMNDYLNQVFTSPIKDGTNLNIKIEPEYSPDNLTLTESHSSPDIILIDNDLVTNKNFKKRKLSLF